MIGYYHLTSIGLILSAGWGGLILATAQVDLDEHNSFADDLTAMLYKKENECTSATGVSMAFSLIYPGCTGDAIEQVRETLGYPNGTNMQLVWEQRTKMMLYELRGQCMGYRYDGACRSEAPILKIANSVWLDDGDTLDQEYELVVGEYVMQTNFETKESSDIVNNWVNESTNGLIKEIVPAGEPLYPNVLIAINSIYLKARWESQFSERYTNLDSFYDSASRDSQASESHFMNKVGTFAYSSEALQGNQVIDLPFAESEMSMIFVLPMNDNVGPVKSTDLLQALYNLESSKRVALSVPKFKFGSEYKDDLKRALIQLGIQAPFMSGYGALCGLFEEEEGCEGLFVSEIIQKTVIDVNERGVEAAAVTAIMIRETAAPWPSEDPVLMILDHPFQFFIYDKDVNAMLFEGRVGKAEVPETEPEVPLLDAKHSDSDFWSNTFGVNPVDP